MQQQEKASMQSTILSNLPTVIGLVIIFMIAQLYFESPGWAPAVSLRTAATQVMPIPSILMGIILLRKHARNVIRKSESLPYDITVLVAGIVMVVLGFVTGWPPNPTQPDLLSLYNNISVIGTMAVTSAIAISIMSPMIRIYRAKTWTMAFLIALSILGFMTYTPIGQMIHPWIPAAGDFVQSYISGAADSAFWISTYIGAIALVVRMILLKEKLKPA
jgi:MFS family permease